MDRLRQIHEMLDSCLTTEILTSLDPPLQRWLDFIRPNRVKFSRHRQVQITILERVGKNLETQLKKDLKGEELLLVGKRVDDFLRKNGYVIKSFL